MSLLSYQNSRFFRTANQMHDEWIWLAVLKDSLRTANQIDRGFLMQPMRLLVLMNSLRVTKTSTWVQGVRPEMKMSSRQRRRHSYLENARNERMGTQRRRNLPQTQFNYLVFFQASYESPPHFTSRGGTHNNVPVNVIFPCHHIEPSMYYIQ